MKCICGITFVRYGHSQYNSEANTICDINNLLLPYPNRAAFLKSDLFFISLMMVGMTECPLTAKTIVPNDVENFIGSVFVW